MAHHRPRQHSVANRIPDKHWARVCCRVLRWRGHFHGKEGVAISCPAEGGSVERRLHSRTRGAAGASRPSRTPGWLTPPRCVQRPHHRRVCERGRARGRRRPGHRRRRPGVPVSPISACRRVRSSWPPSSGSALRPSRDTLRGRRRRLNRQSQPTAAGAILRAREIAELRLASSGARRTRGGQLAEELTAGGAPRPLIRQKCQCRDRPFDLLRRLRELADTGVRTAAESERKEAAWQHRPLAPLPLH